MNQQDKDRLRELANKVVDRSKATQSRDMDFHQAANPAAILSLLEENEALARKAARYEWLRDQHWVQPEAMFRLGLSEEGENDSARYERELDSAIDAAMQHKGD